MMLYDLCDALERLPLPRADEPVHPDRATVLAARADAEAAAAAARGARRPAELDEDYTGDGLDEDVGDEDGVDEGAPEDDETEE